MNEYKNCKDCYYFVDNDMNDKRGTCRRYPPIIDVKNAMLALKAEEDGEDVETVDYLDRGIWQFPGVWYNYWCGEFKEMEP